MTETYKLLVQDATHKVSDVIPFGCSATFENRVVDVIVLTSVSVQNLRISVVWTPKETPQRSCEKLAT